MLVRSMSAIELRLIPMRQPPSDGQPRPEGAPKGLQIGRYQIQRELGRGMMGVVYLATDPDLGRDIALKAIQIPQGANEADRSSFEQRFFSEARSAARLTHPGIVIVHDVGRDPASGVLYMSLQFLPGQTLDHLLKEKGALDWKTALRIGKSVAEALHHAHTEGVVHRDIKPANIMILPSGEAKIMDFGIAKIEASTLTATGQFLGTPLYMSPEQAMARPLDGRSDVFSLGSVLYEMLTGTAPFAGDSVTRILFQVMSHMPAPPSNLSGAIPAAIDHVLRRCLAKEASDRYPDAGALARDLGDILEGRANAGTLSDSVLSDLAPPPSPGATTEAGPTARPVARPAPDIAIPTEAPRPASRRSAAIAGGILALAAFVWVVVRLASPPPVARLVTETSPNPTGADATTAPTATSDSEEPAQIVVDFEHSLKNGVLSIYVDDLKVVEQPFSGRVTRRIGVVEMRSGRVTQTLEVMPGRRKLRVEVSWDDEVKSETSQLDVRPGRRLRLKAKLGSLGGLRKNLSIDWS